MSDICDAQEIGWRSCTCRKCLMAQVEQLRDLLLEVEWGLRGECPKCGGFRGENTYGPPGHHPSCRLAAVLHGP